MTNTAVERHRNGGALTAVDADQRNLDRLMARARIFAKVPGLKKELAGNADAVAGVMLSLEGDGLPATISNVNDCFDWIEGRAARSAHMYQVLAFQAGYDLVPLANTDQLARIRVESRHGGERPKVVEFDISQARAAHRLDEWVEKWQTAEQGKRYAVKHVVRVDGQPVNEPWPDWASKEVNGGRVKRFDAWWSWRADMLYKSAAKRAVKAACPHVLAGMGSPRSDFDHAAAANVDDTTDADGEIVGDTDEMVPNAQAKHDVLDRYKTLGVDEEKAKALAVLLWRSHRLPDGEPIARRRLDALLSVFDEEPTARDTSPPARDDPPVVVDEDTGEIIDQDDDPGRPFD